MFVKSSNASYPSHHLTTSMIPTIEQRDPTKLRPHKRVKAMRRWAKDSDEWAAFLADVREHGIQEPLRITAAGLVVDGETRRQAAVDLQLAEVPCVLVGEADILATITRNLTLRRNWNKSQIAFTAAPLADEWLAERARRHADNLRTGRAETVVSVRVGSGRSTDEFAAQIGVSGRLLEYARELHGIIAKHPELAEQIEKLVYEDGKGLGAIKAGVAGMLKTKGKPKLSRANEQLELFTEAWETVETRFKYWSRMDDDTRRAALPQIRSAVAAMPQDLRQEIKRSIAAVERDEAREG